MLYQLGYVTFQVAPVNVHEVDRQAGADYAAKDVLGSLRQREFVGEGDDQITLSGRLFPHKLGGSVDDVHAMRLAGVPQILVRGDGLLMGWFVIERVTERSSYLDRQGVGKMIDFQISLMRAPMPTLADYQASLLRLFQ